MKLLSYSVKNLRSFTKKASIPVKPITLLVGANSCGKSSLLRLLPLLRQSVETKTKGPILWYGQYVDFGSFNDVLPKGDEAGEINLGFCLRLSKPTGKQRYRRNIILDDTDAEVTLGVRRDENTGRTFNGRIEINIDGHSLDILLNSEGLVSSYKLNGEELLQPSSDYKLLQVDSLFSLIFFPVQGGNQDIERIWPFQVRDRYFLDSYLLQHTRCLFHGSTQENTRRQLLGRLGICTAERFKNHLLNIDRVSPTTLNNIKNYAGQSTWMRRLQGLIIAERVPRLLAEIESSITDLLSQVRYLGPIRASASRFYRQQDLATDEMDSEGSNMAMLLSGLSPEDRESFSSWCSQEMGFTVSIIAEGSHVSIKISDDSLGDSHNLADMGFGYSQMLPLLVVLWSSLHKKDKSDSLFYLSRRDLVTQATQSIHLVEQPELHLHPRYQAKLADLYCKLATTPKDSGKYLSFVIETHSETIINRIGSLIYEKHIKPEDVSVLIVDKHDGSSLVTEASYDEDGVLVNWPYGFFLPDSLI